MGLAQSCSTRCADYAPGENTPFDPEPDLAGIGVIISFMITLIFTILITYVATSVVETFCYNEGDKIAKFSVSSIFERSSIVREKIDTTAKGRKLRQVCFITLIFSDQQLIVGTSLLTSAYVKHCTLTQYHFEIAGLLSLCAFRTFQFAAGILAGTLRSNFSKGWRLFWVTAVANMILVTHIFRMNRYYLDPFGSPLYCLQEVLQSGKGYGGSQAARLAYTIFTEVLLVYCRCLLRLFPSVYNWRPLKGSILSLQRTLLLPGKKHLEALETGDTWTARYFQVLTFVSISARHLISSTAMELGAVTAIFIRVMSLVWDTRNMASERGRSDSEDSWGFGQLLPLFLLALPVTTLVESIRSPWEISSTPMLPKASGNEHCKDSKSGTAPCTNSNMFSNAQVAASSASSSKAAPKSEASQPPTRRVRSLSSPELTARSQAFKGRLSYEAPEHTLGPLDASPTLESQGNGDIYSSEMEWQARIQRYENTYLSKRMFKIWIFLFNTGVLLLHTLIILPSVNDRD